jgi:hypothetical protein
MGDICLALTRRQKAGALPRSRGRLIAVELFVSAAAAARHSGDERVVEQEDGEYAGTAKDVQLGEIAPSC